MRVIRGGDSRITFYEIAAADDDDNHNTYQDHQADAHQDCQDGFPGFGLTIVRLPCNILSFSRWLEFCSVAATVATEQLLSFPCGRLGQDLLDVLHNWFQISHYHGCKQVRVGGLEVLQIIAM